jgi:hypothetical protein
MPVKKLLFLLTHGHQQDTALPEIEIGSFSCLWKLVLDGNHSDGAAPTPTLAFV